MVIDKKKTQIQMQIQTHLQMENVNIILLWKFKFGFFVVKFYCLNMRKYLLSAFVFKKQMRNWVQF